MARRPRRRPAARTVALVVVASAAAILWIILLPIQTVLYGSPFPLTVILGTALCAAPLLVIGYLRTGVILFWAAALLLPLTVSVEPERSWPWPWSVPAILLLVLFIGVLTFVHGWRLGLITMGVAIVGSVMIPVLHPGAATLGSTLASLIVAASVGPLAYLVALLASSRVRVAAELTQERELSASELEKRLLIEERTRIARELHDVVAHSMSVVQVQAATARYRLPDLPAEAASEFDDVAQTAREALKEMRTILGVLRTEEHIAPLTPQSGIDDVPALIDTFRRAGAEVALTQTEDPGAAPTAVQITAYRVVQESVSNAVRHAPGEAISVVMGHAAGATQIRVVNGVLAATDARAQGHGLRGMQERVALVGGTLHVGPDGEGRWEVRAHLPWARSDAPEETK